MERKDDNPNQRTTLSQTRAILAYMREGNIVTPKDARRLCRSDRLSARIMDIEKIVGYKPPRKLVQVSDFDAEGNPCIKRVMAYWLEPES